MTSLLALYLIALTAFIFGLIIVQHFRGTHPLLSIRNFALLGLVVFQSGSGALHLWTKNYSVYPIENPAKTGAIFCALLTAFLALFLISYRVGGPAKPLARMLPKTRVTPSSGSLMMMALLFTGCATALKVLESRVPALGILSALGIVVGSGAMACGLMGWVWGRNFLNPVIMCVTGAVFLFNGAVSVIGGSFGRRSLVAFGAALLWGLFYSKLKYMRPGAMLRWLAFASIPPVMVVALFTAARSSGDKERSLGEQVRAMASGDLSIGVQLLAGGQGTAVGAMFCIERYPEAYQGTFLHSFWMTFLHPVPRALWPAKPIPISTKIAAQANVQGVVVDELTLPPGIVGYIAAEGGLIALLVYGVFYGFFIRFFDELVALNPMSPMVVLPIGTQLGQILGLFRGELSMFGATYWMTVLIFYVALVMLSKLFEGRFVDTADLGVDGAQYEAAAWSYGDDAAGS